MDISDKIKNKAFNRCLNELKESRPRRDYSIVDLLSKLKLQRKKIIARIPLPASEHIKELEKYESNMLQEMEAILWQLIQDGPVKKAREHGTLLERITRNVFELESNVSCGYLDDEIKAGYSPEWRGADVGITSDFSSENFHHDYTVRTRHAKQLTWLMYQLKSLCKEYLNFGTKYEFYETVAKNAESYINLHGDDEVDVRKMIVHLLQQVQAFFIEKDNRLNQSFGSEY